ncbi:MAG TPA: lytic murein transglycosylase [Candidatus Paceibacterota bacterium]|nr:lytic murein transglycosylase [Candidatus Paceibacterota bacterium]
MTKTRIFFIARSILISACILGMVLPLPISTSTSITVEAQTAELSLEERAKLEAELKVLEKEIAEKEAILKQQQKETGTIQKDVKLLTAQIETAKTKIKSKQLAIQKINQEIGQKTKAINDLDSELGREHSSLKQLVKKTQEIDDKGAFYVLLSSKSISNFYEDLDDFLSIQRSLQVSVQKIKHIKSQTEDQKEQLIDKQEQEADAKADLESQKKKVELSEKEKRQLLSISQTKEKEYQVVLAERQKKAQEIRNKLFSFAGGATKAIPFAEALQYANEAAEKTGVRAAFVLAILTQESNLGKNVGTCNRASDPVSKKWQNIMPGPAHKAAGKSSRDDQTVFLQITKALGLDPDSTPLSCPLAGGGWGGAMGPSQFIPTTWQSVAAKVASLVGVGTASPWRARDAIIASSYYLSLRGGAGGNAANERNAACRYYSGRACDGKKPANSFYGNNVMALSRAIQADIDYLNQYGISRR